MIETTTLSSNSKTRLSLGFGLLSGIALAGLVPGCAMDADLAADDYTVESAQLAVDGCALDASSLVMKYTEGDDFFTTEVRADKLAAGHHIEANWQVSWSLQDGTKGALSDSLAVVTGAVAEPSEIVIPMAGVGRYTLELVDVAGCESVRKTFEFLPPVFSRDDFSTEACSTGNTFNGGSSADNLNGGPNNDVLIGNGGGDELRGRNCHDDLFGGKGNDELFGGDGDDYLDGGSDTIFGGDKCTGGPGIDQFINCETVTP